MAGKGLAPSREEHNRVDLYKVLGPGGVDFPAFFAVLREGNYDGWIMLDYDAEVYAAFNSPAGAQPLIPASDPGRVCHRENRQQGSPRTPQPHPLRTRAQARLTLVCKK